MTQREIFGDDFQGLNEPVPSGIAPKNASSIPAFMSFFSDCPKCARQNFNLNGGVFILDRRKSRPCLQECSMSALRWELQRELVSALVSVLVSAKVTASA